MKQLITNRDGIGSAIGRITAAIYDAIADGPLELSILHAKGSAVQSSKIHAMYNDILKVRKFKYYGVDVDLMKHGANDAPEYCKALLVKWFDEEMRAAGEELRHPGKLMFCPRQGQYFYCRPSTKDMSVKEKTKHIEWLYAFGAEINAPWSEPVRGYDEYPELKNG